MFRYGLLIPRRECPNQDSAHFSFSVNGFLDGNLAPKIPACPLSPFARNFSFLLQGRSKMGTVLFFWIGFSIVVAVAASARGRTGILWFLLSLLISPLIALLLVLFMELKNVPSAAPPPSIPDAAFEPDSVYAGIPYRLSPDGS